MSVARSACCGRPGGITSIREPPYARCRRTRRQQHDEHEQLHEAEQRELPQLHGERIEEHDLDVEDDEQHRRQVVRDREARRLRTRRSRRRTRRGGSWPPPSLAPALAEKHRSGEQCPGDHGRKAHEDEDGRPVAQHAGDDSTQATRPADAVGMAAFGFAMRFPPLRQVVTKSRAPGRPPGGTMGSW